MLSLRQMMTDVITLILGDKISITQKYAKKIHKKMYPLLQCVVAALFSKCSESKSNT